MRLLSVFCYFVLAFQSTVAFAQVQITGMRIEQPVESEILRLVLDLNAPVVHKLFTLKAPHRLVLDLKNTKPLRHSAEIPTHQTFLKRIRSAAHGRDLRIVFDLGAPISRKTLSLKTRGKNQHRLILDIKGQGLRKKAKPAPPKSRKPTVPPLKRERLTPSKRPQLIDQPIQVYKPALVKKRRIVVAIDAGHGGVDPGAVGQTGIHEKAVVLAIAKELVILLKQSSNIRPVLIRKDDYFLPLNKRVELARKYKADLLVSIHADAYPDKTAGGSSVYMLSRKGASNEAVKWLAERENSADLIGGVSLNDKDDLLASVLLDLSQTSTLTASAHVGQQVLTALGKVGRSHYRHLQKAGFIVLRAPDVPSILVEVGFISNPAEELLLSQPAHRLRLAQAIAIGIENYFAEYAPLLAQY